MGASEALFTLFSGQKYIDVDVGGDARQCVGARVPACLPIRKDLVCALGSACECASVSPAAGPAGGCPLPPPRTLRIVWDCREDASHLTNHLSTSV